MTPLIACSVKTTICDGNTRRSGFNNGNEIRGDINGLFFSAKILDVPSESGINGTPVTRLTVCNAPHWDASKTVFNFDQGMDMIALPLTAGAVEEVVNQIVSHFSLKTLPEDDVMESCIIRSGVPLPKMEM